MAFYTKTILQPQSLLIFDENPSYYYR